jgi:hypothetical protein
MADRALASQFGQLLEVKVMANLLILAGALLVAFRMIVPVLRVAIRLVAKLIALTLFITVAILCLIAFLTHGTFI